jgi:clan AA aspartic protease (TIGR02281 family)
LPLKFIFDTGASDVSISLTEAMFMLKNGYLKKEDLGEKIYYSIANGDVSAGTKLNIKEIEFGGLKLNNIEASIVHETNAPLLLGQSVISRLGKIQLDGNKLTILNGSSNNYDFSISLNKINNPKSPKDFIHNKSIEIKELKSTGQKTSMGLIYKMLVENNTRKPEAGEKIYIKYSGYFENGELFDTCVKEISQQFGIYDKNRDETDGYKPFPKIYGKSDVLPGLNNATYFLKFGEKILVMIPSNLAYGKEGSGMTIPPNSNLIFELELLQEQN